MSSKRCRHVDGGIPGPSLPSNCTSIVMDAAYDDYTNILGNLGGHESGQKDGCDNIVS